MRDDLFVSLPRRFNDALERVSGRRLMKRSGQSNQNRSQFVTRAQVRDLQLRAVYAALSQLSLRQGLHVSNDAVDLRTAELKVFSQNGEDGVIDALIGALSVESGFFVEFGVGDGSECNTRLLAEVFGWSGLYIEPEKQQFDALSTRYRGSNVVSCKRDSVTPENVNALFASAGVPQRFGLLSIDVDGQDYWIWEALSPDYQPDLVVIECNSGFPRGAKTVEQRGLAWAEDFGDSFGASVSALADLASRKGYTLVHVDLCGVNAFFVRHESLSRISGQVLGHSDRSPNYGMTGQGHPAAVSRQVTDVGRAGQTSSQFESE